MWHKRIAWCLWQRWPTASWAFVGWALVGWASLEKTVWCEEAVKPISFNADVRPILSDKCFACHGFDANKRMAELRLDTYEGATRLVEGRAAIVPGNREASEVWRRIQSTDDDERMPPSDSHKRLTAVEMDVIGKWIQQGAPYQKHWAFEMPDRHEPPRAAVSNPIDAFIAAHLDRQSLVFSSEADRAILVRRVTFALTGLPPTAEQVSTFLLDRSPAAYDKLVDRLLASPKFGEEMARHWLDVARYGDTHGMHLDNERQTWAYRDWVVSAFNRNVPYDVFTIEQLAGDLLPNPSLDQLIATGFNRCNVTTSEGGSIGEELLYRYAVDRTSTVMQTWLGLTGGCAVCHDHKFDPLSQQEFYSFYAFFNSAADPAMDGNKLLTQPVARLESMEDRDRLAQFDQSLSELQRRIDEASATVAYEDPASAPAEETAMELETWWLDDAFPADGPVQASPPTKGAAGNAPHFVTADEGAPVLSGTKSLKRSDSGLGQDVWGESKTSLVLPQQAVLVAHVWLDPQNPPRAIMLQYFREGWKHRAVWGDYDAIDWGAKNTPERFHMGMLPAKGEWIRLEVSADKLGLASGDAIKGFALTQFGGTVYWDRVGVRGELDARKDPTRSFLAWWRQSQGKDIADLPADLKKIAKEGPDKKVDEPNRARLLQYYLQEVCADTQAQFAELIKQRKQLREARKQLDDSIPATFIYQDLPKPRESFVMMRGAYDKPGSKVEPNTPAILPPLRKTQPDGRANRLDLAQWLVSPDNPLTARVTVNRLWQQFFGTGLVKTSYDFGSQGELPSHPELLDWLALEFQDSEWNVKALVKQIVSSQTFRQSSAVSPELLRRDPENRTLARGPRVRLDAEQIRDNALFVSGLLQQDIGGKGVRTYQPENIWEPVGFAGSNTRFYKRDSGAALYRRSIYTFFKRTAPPPFMVNFDAPNREQFCTKRERSNTPLQALQLMNDVQYVEAARALATHLLSEGGDDFQARMRYAFRLVLARQPLPQELEILERQYELHRTRYEAAGELAGKLIAVGESKPSPSLAAQELAAYTMLASTLLNLDETITRN